jgi:hypothetical protein
MRPLPGFAKRADAYFVIGQTYTLEPIEERSAKSHRHFFAAVSEAWKNLPEALAPQYPNSEALRKRALIMTGFCDCRVIACKWKAEARRLAAILSPMMEHAIISVTGTTVTIWTAQSQSEKAMGAKRFQESKQAVLDKLAEMIGVQPEALSSAAKDAQ